MYNGIGLTTPRGSGTNGHVQRNWALMKPRVKEQTYRSEQDLTNLDAVTHRQPNQEILDHERKRKIELKCAEFADILEEQGFTQEAINNKVGNYRKMLMGQGGKLDRPVGLWERPAVTETHHVAEAQKEKNARLREAFGISEYFVDGSSFDPDREAKEKVARSNAIQEQEKQKALVKEKDQLARYELVHTPSPEPVAPQMKSAKMKKRKHKESSSSEESKKKAKKRKKERSSKVKDNRKSKKKKRKSSVSSESSDDSDSGSEKSDDSSSEEEEEKKRKKKVKKKEKKKVGKKKKKKRKKQQQQRSSSESSRASSPECKKPKEEKRKPTKNREKDESGLESPSPKRKRKSSPLPSKHEEKLQSKRSHSPFRAKPRHDERRSRSPRRHYSRDRRGYSGGSNSRHEDRKRPDDGRNGRSHSSQHKRKVDSKSPESRKSRSVTSNSRKAVEVRRRSHSRVNRRRRTPRPEKNRKKIERWPQADHSRSRSSSTRKEPKVQTRSSPRPKAGLRSSARSSRSPHKEENVRSLTPKKANPKRSNAESDSEKRRKERKKDNKPLPVVRLRSSSDEEHMDDVAERDHEEEDKELRMLRLLKSGLAAKAKESLQRKIPKPIERKKSPSPKVDKNIEVFDIKILPLQSPNEVNKDEFDIGKTNGKAQSGTSSKSKSRSSSRSSYRSSSSSSSTSRSGSRSRSSRSSSTSSSTSSSGSAYRSRSPSIPRRHGSPSFLDRRRITSARKRPIPYHRQTPTSPSSESSYSGSPWCSRRRSTSRSITPSSRSPSLSSPLHSPRSP